MSATKTRRRGKKPRITQTWFEFGERPAFPRANRTRTSIAAAAAIAEQAPTLRGTVYEFVARQGMAGATREEIAEGCAMKLQTVCGRVHELLELGLVHRTDETRPTSSGTAAAVIRAQGVHGAPVRTCRVCGCRDDQACVVDGVPCSWVESDLCSACAE